MSGTPSDSERGSEDDTGKGHLLEGWDWWVSSRISGAIIGADVDFSGAHFTGEAGDFNGLISVTGPNSRGEWFWYIRQRSKSLDECSTTRTSTVRPEAGNPWGTCADGEVLHLNFEVASTGVTSKLTSVDGLSNDEAVVVGEGGVVLRTDDAAVTWNAVSVGTTADLHGVEWEDDGETWLIVGAAGTLVASTDGGDTFSMPSADTTEDLLDARRSDAGVWLVVGEGPTALLSEDLITFTAVTAPGTGALNAVAWDHDAWLVASDDGGIYVSEDAGATWSEDLAPTGSAIVSLDAQDGASAVAAGAEDGTMWFRRARD